MSSSECIICGEEFNYFLKAATIICSNNHVVCKGCHLKLIMTNPKCPICFNDLTQKTNQFMINSAEIFKNDNSYWKPRNNFNESDTEYLGPIREIQKKQPSELRAGKINKNIIFCICSIIFMVVFIILLVTRLRMQSCSFWDADECKQQYGTLYCCKRPCSGGSSSSQCIMLPFIQSFGEVAATEAFMGFSFFLMIAFFCFFCFNRKVESTRERMRARYQNLISNYEQNRVF